MRKLFLLLFFLISVKIGFSQENKLQINEILIHTTDTTSPRLLSWIEIYNPNESDIYLNNYFFTNDPNNIDKYTIADSIIIPAHSYILLYNSDAAVEMSAAYCLSFMLNDISILNNGNAFFAIYDKTNSALIDSCTYTISEQQAGVSIGFCDSVWVKSLIPTPLAVNQLQTVEADENLTASTSNTTTLVIVGILVVVVIIYAFTRKPKKEIAEKEENSIQSPIVTQPEIAAHDGIDPEILALTMAFHLHLNEGNHETEEKGFWLRSNPIHSPWANRSFNFKKTPNKK